MFPSIMITASLVLAGLASQQGNPPPKDEARPGTDVTPRLRAQAARLERGHASEFFAALIEATQPGNREAPTGEVPALIKEADQATRDALQAPALIKQADEVTREVLRFWLDRALAPGSHPPTLQEWQDFKERIVGHAEAIILEAVLRPEQARRWRDRASRPLIPPLPGRYSIIPIDYVDGNIPAVYTRAEYYGIIHAEAYEQRASDLFGVLIGYERRILKPFPGLKRQQAELIERVDRLARNARRYWWFRDIEPVPKPREEDPQGIRELPPTSAMQLRLSERGKRLRASVAAHAEEMVLEAVLTRDQAEQAKLELWRRRGLHALLDPELAARLHLSRAQRNELAERLTERVEVYHRVVRSDVPVYNNQTPSNVVNALEQRWKEEVDHKVAVLDQPIWEILQPAQLRALARLLNKPVPVLQPDDR